MRKINISQGKFTIVDDEDFEALNKYKWQYDSGYCSRRQWIKGGKGKSIKIYLHQSILKSYPAKIVDHINGNKLDNRKNNLRFSTHAENLMNRSFPINNTSGYKGVIFDKARKKWRAEIKVHYKSFYLGRFNTKEEAALAYNQSAIKHFGEYAFLNKI